MLSVAWLLAGDVEKAADVAGNGSNADGLYRRAL
jgi:hypothetical protein